MFFKKIDFQALMFDVKMRFMWFTFEMETKCLNFRAS